MATEPRDIIATLKKIKSTCIGLEMDEVHLERRYQEELMGNYNYQKPKSMIEQRKIAEDRAIRKNQEKEFFESMKKEERKKSEEIIEKVEVKAEENRLADLKKERERIRNSLRIFSEGMTIKLRLPSGSSETLTVPSS